MKTTASPKFTTVDDYINSLPSETKAVVTELRQTIRKAAPKAEEMISYNIPTFTYEGSLVYFAAWKAHISLYPRTAEVEKKLKKEIAPYASSKGTLKFPLDEPLPLGLITKIVKIRLQENLDKMKIKTKK